MPRFNKRQFGAVMIKVNSLYSLEEIKDCYVFDTKKLEVLNTELNIYMRPYINNRGYQVIRLLKKDGIYKTIFIHKIVALAMIENRPYKVIEHLNDDKLDNRPENLAFSCQRNNVLRAFDNGLRKCSARTFKVVLRSGEVFHGTMRQIAIDSKIAMGTLYDNLIYKSKPNGNCPSSRKIASIIETGQQTIERHGKYETM